MNYNVPLAPGVPPIQRAALALTSALLIADHILQSYFFISWGIFSKNGLPVLTGDSVISVDLRKEYHIADFPVEEGGFASYNKVSKPGDIRLTFTVGGSTEARSQFLKTVDSMASSLELFTVVTPEVVYPTMNVVHYDYGRSQRSGVSLLTVTVFCNEVRIAATSVFTQTETPAGEDPQVNGTTQTTTYDDVQPRSLGEKGSSTSAAPAAQVVTPAPTVAPTVTPPQLPSTPGAVTLSPGPYSNMLNHESQLI